MTKRNGAQELTDWDMMRSRTSWEVAEELKEKWFVAAERPAELAAAVISSSLKKLSLMVGVWQEE